MAQFVALSGFGVHSQLRGILQGTLCNGIVEKANSLMFASQY